ncbi:MAG: hypothetical protein ABI870_02700 [Rhodanobacter sp.]
MAKLDLRIAAGGQLTGMVAWLSQTAGYPVSDYQYDVLNAEVASTGTDLREAAGSFAKLGPARVGVDGDGAVAGNTRVGGVLSPPDADLAITTMTWEEAPQVLDVAASIEIHAPMACALKDVKSIAAMTISIDLDLPIDSGVESKV